MLPNRPIRIANSSIASVDNLCVALGISNDELDEAIWLPEEKKYAIKRVPKVGGGERVVYNPHKLIRRIQRKINSRILASPSVILWPSYLYGSLPNQAHRGRLYKKDYVACAQAHCGARSVLKMDVKEFFDNISQDRVQDIFIDLLKYPAVVSEVLSTICCYEGRVVQGGLTSSYLAGLCLHDVEAAVFERLVAKGFVYTRYVDDITISSRNERASFEFAQRITEQMLEAKDLPVNSKKTQISRASTEPLLVHGLRVAYDSPRLQVGETKRIRATVKNLENLAKEPNYRTSHAYRHDFNRCMGRVNKLGRVMHGSHSHLVARLRKIEPLPSPRDILRAEEVVSRLEKDFKNKAPTYWYARRFYRVQERINVLKRSFPVVAKELRERLRLIRTSYRSDRG